MKKKDIPVLIIVVIVSSVASFFLSQAIIGTPETEPQVAEIVEPITDDFPSIDSRYTPFFNEESINPTQLIRVGDEESNTDPFGSN